MPITTTLVPLGLCYIRQGVKNFLCIDSSYAHKTCEVGIGSPFTDEKAETWRSHTDQGQEVCELGLAPGLSHSEHVLSSAVRGPHIEL